MAFGNIGAVVDQQGVVALGKTLDVIVDMGGFGGGDDLLPGCLRTAVSDILINRPVKEPGILENHGIGQAQALSCQQGGILLVHQDFPRLDIIEAHQQVDKGGFSGAGGADDGDHAALIRLHAEIL